MLSIIVEVLFALAFVAALLNGKMAEISTAGTSAAASAITTIIGMAGGLCFWSGLMEIMAQSGLSQRLTRLLKAPIRMIYGDFGGDREVVELLGQNMAANILGLGSAATPAGLAAAGRMRMLYEKGRISKRPMMLLMVVNTVSIQLLPITVASARSALGAGDPYDIILPVWCASICSFLAALIFAKASIKEERE